MTDVTIETTDTEVHVQSPYHPKFVRGAKKLKGQFKKPFWVFDIRDQGRVEELCRQIYGTDGSPCERVTVECKATKDLLGRGRKTELYCAGRQIARVKSKYSGADLGHKVVVTQGFFGSGGSHKNPTVDWSEDTVFEIRDLPRPAAEKLVQKHPNDARITEYGDRKQALRAEKERLQKRIEEINRELAE